MKRNNRHSGRKKLRTVVIELALCDDQKAIEEIIEYYRPYMSKLAAVELYNEAGYLVKVIDHDKVSELEWKLIISIKKFKR